MKFSISLIVTLVCISWMSASGYQAFVWYTDIYPVDKAEMMLAVSTIAAVVPTVMSIRWLIRSWNERQERKATRASLEKMHPHGEW